MPVARGRPREAGVTAALDEIGRVFHSPTSRFWLGHFSISTKCRTRSTWPTQAATRRNTWKTRSVLPRSFRIHAHGSEPFRSPRGAGPPQISLAAAFTCTFSASPPAPQEKLRVDCTQTDGLGGGSLALYLESRERREAAEGILAPEERPHTATQAVSLACVSSSELVGRRRARWQPTSSTCILGD